MTMGHVKAPQGGTKREHMYAVCSIYIKVRIAIENSCRELL